MISTNPVKAAENLPVLSPESFQPIPQPTFGLKQVFVGPNGLRAGWRVLMFIVLFALLLGSFVLIRAGGPEAFREQYKNQNQSQITITPSKQNLNVLRPSSDNDSAAGSNGFARFRPVNCSGSHSIIRSACDEQATRISYCSRRICTDATFNTSNRS